MFRGLKCLQVVRVEFDAAAQAARQALRATFPQSLDSEGESDGCCMVKGESLLCHVEPDHP